jgi:hypothetical protein
MHKGVVLKTILKFTLKLIFFIADLIIYAATPPD